MRVHRLLLAVAGSVFMLAGLNAASAQTMRAGLPPDLASAGVSIAQWDSVRAEVRRQAQRARISERALLAAVEATGSQLAASGRFDAPALERALKQALGDQADQIADLQDRLRRLTGDADPDLAGLFAQARQALDEGRLSQADRVLADVAGRDLSALMASEAELERRRLRAGETIASRGQIAFVQSDYLAAAAHFERAAQTAPAGALDRRWQYHMYQAASFRVHDEVFLSADSLQQAIRIYAEIALPLAPPSQRPSDWAQTQNDLGNALRIKGERGDPQALRDAVSAFRAALTVRTRAVDRRLWAVTQINLGVTLLRLGLNGEINALGQAVEALELAIAADAGISPEQHARAQLYLGMGLTALAAAGDPDLLLRARAVLEMAARNLNRDGDDALWAETQSALGVALLYLGMQNDRQALTESIRAFEASLTVRTRSRDENGWAETQALLGTASLRLGQYGDQAALERAIDALEASSQVRTATRHPQAWGEIQNNLGIAYAILLERGREDAAALAIQHLQAALTVRTRAANSSAYARTMQNLAGVYADLGRIPEARSAARQAAEVSRQIGDATGVRLAEDLIAQLR